MRATYEDLLRIARRRAVEAYNLATVDTSDFVAGVQAMLSATRHHLRWLGHELSAEDLLSEPNGHSDGALFRLAQSIGAGADLLATQNRSTGSVLDDENAVKGARSAVGRIAAMGVCSALTRLASGRPDIAADRGGLGQHLLGVLTELESLLEPMSSDMGRLAGLATRLPSYPVDELSRIISLAADWQVAHEATSPRSLLTRDLRSTSAQLRTLAGYVAHLVRFVDALNGGPSDDLAPLMASLREAASVEAEILQLYRTRLSDAGGRSDGIAESAFVELLAALQGWLREGDRLKRPDELGIEANSGGRVRELIDEIVHAGHRVATHREESVWFLINGGLLFVPRVELAKRDREFINRPFVWLLRYPQPHWVRTTRISCFDELTSALAEVTAHFGDAATISRRLAGTTEQHRPFGADFSTEPRFLPPPRWNQPTDEQILTMYADTPGIDR